MSRLNTLYPDDEFLKGISNVMGKIDSKNETEIKQEIEQIGYKEFYRYSKEKDVYIKQLKNNWNELKKWLESKGTSTQDENDALCYFYTYNKMQELQGDDEN